MKQHRLLQSSLLSSIYLLTVILSTGCENKEQGLLLGQLESDRIEINAEVSEPITAILVREGETVKSGQALIQLDAQRFETKILETNALLAQHQARLEELLRGPRLEKISAARASLQSAETEREFRKIEFTRAQRLLDQKLTSIASRDSAKTAFDEAQSNVDFRQAQLDELIAGSTNEEISQARQAVKQIESKLQLLEIDRDRLTLKAPSDAIVDNILYEKGERPQAGQTIIVLLSGDQAYARVYISETMRSSVSVGSTATINFDGANKVLSGRVRSIANEAAFTPYYSLTEHDRGRLSYLAKIDILDADERLPDGLPVQIELVDE